jgi:hypothetical protein
MPMQAAFWIVVIAILFTGAFLQRLQNPVANCRFFGIFEIFKLRRKIKAIDARFSFLLIFFAFADFFCDLTTWITSYRTEQDQQQGNDTRSFATISKFLRHKIENLVFPCGALGIYIFGSS